MVDDRHRKHLLSVARDAIARHTGVSSLPPPPAPDPDLPPGRSVFVTLSTGGRLRGCVGQLEPRGSLDEIVASCAVAAATADPRFPPLEPAELAHVTIEISLLNPPIPVAGPEDIVLVAGKGHEDYQQVGDERRPYSDRATVQEILEAAA